MKRYFLISFVSCLFIFSFVSLGYSSSEPQKKKSRATPRGEKEKDKVLQGSWEFSTAASIDIHKVSYMDLSSSVTTISIPARIGYFITNNIEIEPEINYYRVSSEGESASTFFLFANGVFNFATSSQVVPFVLGGAGLSGLSGGDESESTLALDAGAGIKWFASSRVALRAEYRFIYYSYGIEGSDEGLDNTHHNIYLGISIFF